MSPSEVFKAQELVYELKIGDIMTRALITAVPETTMREVKQVLRDHRISGLPVMRDGHLVGIVSIENLIRALEANDLDAPVNNYMSTLLLHHWRGRVCGPRAECVRPGRGRPAPRG